MLSGSERGPYAMTPDNEATGGRGILLPHLRAWRESRALTQIELADKAGLSNVTISAAETGNRIRVRTARKIAEALGITPQDLIYNLPG